MAKRMMLGLRCLGGGVMVHGNKNIALYLLHHRTRSATSITTSRAMIRQFFQIFSARVTPLTDSHAHGWQALLAWPLMVR